MSRLDSRIPFGGDGRTRNIPVLSSSGQHSRMDITPPPAHADSDRAINGAESNSLNVPNPAIGAAAAAQQPKVVQTAFIHKLYKYVFGLRVSPGDELTVGPVC